MGAGILETKRGMLLAMSEQGTERKKRRVQKRRRKRMKAWKLLGALLAVLVMEFMSLPLRASDVELLPRDLAEVIDDRRGVRVALISLRWQVDSTGQPESTARLGVEACTGSTGVLARVGQLVEDRTGVVSGRGAAGGMRLLLILMVRGRGGGKGRRVGSI
jgi:hypothetical protein